MTFLLLNQNGYTFKEVIALLVNSQLIHFAMQQSLGANLQEQLGY